MNKQDKLTRLSALITPDTASDDLLLYLLEQAEGIVLNKRYPFGVPDGAVVPVQYEHIQIRVALELFSKMGAEGQIAHKENGVDRTYEAADVSPSLLRGILPLVGTVS